ncbi:MAG: hypothetical protein R2932_36995 [Caldilineaceae bacterium]
MHKLIVNSKSIKAGVAHLTRYTVHILIVLPVVAALVIYGIWKALPQTSTQMAASAPTAVISAKALEERFGLRITRIAVTGGGGIIDLRYRVLDKEKAAYVLDDPNNELYLVVEESGVTLMQPGKAMKHNSQLKNNMSYYTFYPNTQNVIQPGTPVAVAFGSLRVEPIVAQ